MKKEIKKVGKANVAKYAALADIKGEMRVSVKDKAHWGYKSKGYSPFKNGEFDLSDAPYDYNYAFGKTVPSFQH